MRLIDDHEFWEADARGHIRIRKERLQRFIGLEIKIKDAGAGATVIQLDFIPKVEGFNHFACDALIAASTSNLESIVGPGDATRQAPDTKVPASPFWLRAVTGLALLGLCCDVLKAIVH